MGKTEQMGFHFPRAVENGVTPGRARRDDHAPGVYVGLAERDVGHRTRQGTSRRTADLRRACEQCEKGDDHARRRHLWKGRRPVRGARRAGNHPADRRGHQAVGDLRVRVGPVDLSRHQPVEGADADRPRILRHRRGGRPRGHVGQAGAVRHRFVLRVRQHLPALPGRVPDDRASTASWSSARRRRVLRVPLADGTLVGDARRFRRTI